MNSKTIQYKDVSINPVTLDWLVGNEPEWAENQIRHRDNLEACNAKLRKALVGLVGTDTKSELEGMEAAIRVLPAPE